MIDPVRFGLAGGVLKGLWLFLTTIVSIYTGYADDFLETVGSLLPGFDITWLGSVLGLVYGFICGFIFFFLLAWLYNQFQKHVS